jgi:hexosaminidase
MVWGLSAVVALALVVFVRAPLAAGAAGDQASPNIIPWPKSLTLGQGYEERTSANRIVAQDAKLEPLAKVLAGEIYLSTAVKMPTAVGTGAKGDITLRLTGDVATDEGYRLTVGPAGIVVEARTYRGAAWGTVSLLQALEVAGGKLRVPQMTIVDEPAAKYRGLLIDVARQWHPVETIRPIIQMCRLYKINYMQLHLNDQQSTVFPFKAFPQLQSSSKGQRRTWTREEVVALVKYADERGVTIVPELEGPGHHAGNLRSLWGRGNTLDIANEKTYEGLKVLIGELCEVFASSPYIHIGADEGSFGHLGKSEEELAYMAKYGIKGGLLNHYVKRVDEIIKGYKKQTICWEGFHGDGGGLPKDIIVMPFESAYNPANSLVSRGFSVINTAWKPLYVVGSKKWPAEYIYSNWNLWLWEHHVNTKCHIQLKPTDPVLGAQMCAWEQSADVELPSTRERIHAMSERIWNPDAGKAYADFAARAVKTDALLDRILGFIDVQTKGLTGEENRGFYYFSGPITVSMHPLPLGNVHYTLDGKDPTLQSPKYTGPFTLTRESTHFEKLFFNSRTKRHEAEGDIVRVKARMFDAEGKPIGDVMTLRQYWHKTP